MKALLCISVLPVISAFFAPALLAAPLVGAIRWDAWDEGGSIQAAVAADLGPNQWHYRLPFFTTVTGTNSVSFANGDTQATMDQEINYAANAGINYWAFVTYADSSGMSNALHLYLDASTTRSSLRATRSPTSATMATGVCRRRAT